MNRNKDIFIRETDSAKEALKKLDRTGKKVLLVVDTEERLLGAITDGDIRRYILKGKSLDEAVKGLYNPNPTYISSEDFTAHAAEKLFLANKIELLPIVDKEHKVVNYTTWNEIFSGNMTDHFEGQKIDIPVVIMAGGRGDRLEPFNKVFPKPLMPLGDKPIIEVIIDEFRKQGVNRYFLTLNYKAEIIEAFFNSKEKDYDVRFTREKEYMGTAGSLRCVEGLSDGLFIVSNCDIIVKANYKEVVDFHKEHEAALTVLSAIQHHKIPYGVINFREKGEVINIVEKPEYTFTINAGVYVLSSEVLSLIPKNGVFDMPDLIKALLQRGDKVLTYPVNENDYIDIGQWDEYKKSVERLRMFT